MDKLTKHIPDQIPWCMLFTDDVVLVDERKEDANMKLEMQRNTSEDKSFELSYATTECLKCNSSNKANRNEGGVRIDDTGRSRSFWYLGFIMQKDREPT